MDAHAQADHYKTLGNAYFQRGDTSNALQCYSEAIVHLTQAYNPRESVYFSNRARVYIELKRWSEAVKDCETAVSLRPDNVKAEILMTRAEAHLAQEQGSVVLAEDALRAIDAALQTATEQRNNEYREYCKLLRRKVRALAGYLSVREMAKEKAGLAKYYSDLLGADWESRKVLETVRDR